MYKVLIADDEEIICRGLAGMISRRPEFEIVAIAEDGEIALEKAMDTLPDLMLVDINMPFLNGLEFIERIREVLTDVMVIIVTGYDDFAYVQKALQLGVTDYVLKPVMEQPFTEVLDKAVSRLEHQTASRNYVNWLEEKIEQHRDHAIDDFLNSLLRGEIDETQMERDMGYLKIQIPIPYELTMLHVYREYEDEDGGGAGVIDADGYPACCSIIQTCFQPYCEILCFRTEEGAVGILSAVLSGEQWEELEISLKSAMEGQLHAKMEFVRSQGNGFMDLSEIFRKTVELYRERSHYSELVRKTIALIRTRWGDSEFSLQSAADELFVSASYLSRMFRRETGENFAAFLTRKRISEAKFLLKNTNLKMYEIAQKTGYTSQHYFSNAFKKGMGFSPADYRKNLLK